MTEKRYIFDPSISHFTDTKTDKIYCEYNLDEVVDMLNKYEKENQQLKTQTQRLKEGILWLLEILCKKDPKSDIEFWCQTFFECNYQTAKEKYGTLSKMMKIE